MIIRFEGYDQQICWGSMTLFWMVYSHSMCHTPFLHSLVKWYSNYALWGDKWNICTTLSFFNIFGDWTLGLLQGFVEIWYVYTTLQLQQYNVDLALLYSRIISFIRIFANIVWGDDLRIKKRYDNVSCFYMVLISNTSYIYLC